MTVVLKRKFQNDLATIGEITIDNMCIEPIYTLENPLRATDKDNRIPAGEYVCKPFSGKKYKNVYEVTNVPNRTAILFHWGNFEKDTLGCILLGNKFKLEPEPMILESKKCFERFRKLIGKNSFTLIIEDVITTKLT